MAENISKIQLNGTVYTIGNETTTAVTSASTDNEIPTAKAVYDAIPQGGGGKAVSGGTNISITTGETADTINCTLPYNKLDDKENYSIFGSTHPSFKNQATYAYNSLFIGNSNEVKGNSSFYTFLNNYVIGNNNKINGKISEYSNGSNIVIGTHNSLSGTNLSHSYVIGQDNSGYTSNTLLTGWYNQAYNGYESAFGKYNASNTGSTDADKSLFSVGNGTYSARHNAFEIRQNGDIYITKDGQDVKLQDQLGGGGGSSYTAGDGIDITNDVISVTGKVDTSTYNTYTAATDTALASKADTATTYTKTEVDTALSGYVTTNTTQEITGNKTFIGSSRTSEKPIIFKQANDNHKLGFVCRNTAETNNEVASFEFRPNTFTIDGIQHPLLYFGHYRNTQTANAGVPQTVIGFRQYDQLNAAAYHYLLPLPEKARMPFSLTRSFKDYYAPMGFKVNTSGTIVTTDETGVVDLSSYLGGGSGLKKWEGTRAEYNALSSYDADTLYVITDEDVEIPTVPTKVSAFENDKGYLTEHQDISGLATKTELNNKQDKLVSGTNVKTINGQSLLGSGDIATVPVTTDNVNYTNSSSTKTLTQVLNNTEEITFTLEDGSTVTKKFILG